MKNKIRILFLLTFFQQVCAYHLADISFVFADEDLLREIGVLDSADKQSIEEETEVKEKIEPASSAGQQGEALPEDSSLEVATI